MQSLFGSSRDAWREALHDDPSLTAALETTGDEVKLQWRRAGSRKMAKIKMAAVYQI